MIETGPFDERLPSEFGIQKIHAHRLVSFCKGEFKARELIIIIRASNPDGIKFHGRKDHLPKPAGVKAKTSTGGGRVWKYDKNRAFVREAHEKGTWYFSDYDLNGVWERRHMGNYERLYVGNWNPEAKKAIGARPNPGTDRFLRSINDYVCRIFGSPDMFQHGSEHDWRTNGRPTNPLPDDAFAAFEHTGKVFLMDSAWELEDYYRSRKLAWIFD